MGTQLRTNMLHFTKSGACLKTAMAFGTVTNAIAMSLQNTASPGMTKMPLASRFQNP